MSGILGVGSKSGVIGSTEIPGGYEEGEWSPAFDDSTDVGWSASTLGDVKGTYIKIGNLVTFMCSFYLTGASGTVAGGNKTNITGFPYAMSTNSGNAGNFSFGFAYNTANGCLFRCQSHISINGMDCVADDPWGSPQREGGRFQGTGHYYIDV